MRLCTALALVAGAAAVGNRFDHAPIEVQEKILVIGAGFARSGTASLNAALEILGYHTYHMKEVRAYDHSELWHDVLREKSATKASKIITESGFNATMDRPGALFAVELAKLHPEARVLLAAHDTDERWIEGIYLLKSMMDVGKWAPWSLLPFNVRFDAWTQDLWDDVGCSIRGSQIDEAKCLAFNEAFHNRIRKEVPAAQLLELNLKKGWKPLCKFLKVPIPTYLEGPEMGKPVIFPEITDGLQTKKTIKALRIVAVLFHVFVIGFAIFVLFSIYSELQSIKSKPA